MEPDTKISKLIALKRFEQPPEGYEIRFLYEFHRRQRARLLRRPWYLKSWDNLLGLWPTFEVPRFAYGALAAMALAGAVWVYRAPGAAPEAGGAAVARTEITAIPDFSLEPRRPVTIGNTLPVSTRADVSQHYVLQPRPASNELPLSF